MLWKVKLSGEARIRSAESEKKGINLRPCDTSDVDCNIPVMETEVHRSMLRANEINGCK